MIEQLPKDARDLILYRLGQPRIDKIITRLSIAPEVEEKMPQVKSKIRRGMPKERAPVTRFYAACLREMGSLAKTNALERLPSPGKAWLQVYRARFEKAEPTFTHKQITDVIEYFGGWEHMWRSFGKVKEDTARNRFVMQFKELTEK